MVAEHRAKRRVSQVGGGVIALDRQASFPVHFGLDRDALVKSVPGAFLESPEVDEYAGHPPGVRDPDPEAFSREDSGVRDLPPGFAVERRPVQHDLEPPGISLDPEDLAGPGRMKFGLHQLVRRCQRDMGMAEKTGFDPGKRGEQMSHVREQGKTGQYVLIRIQRRPVNE